MKPVIRKIAEEIRLPGAARRERRRDHAGLPAFDPGIERFIQEGISWLARAQDLSASADGGVARDFSLIKGWATSYPETTGYIVPTMIEHGLRADDSDSLDRARKMLEWLERIQLPSGGFQGGKIDATPVVPVTFNTGQILLGLAAGVAQFGTFRDATMKAAGFLGTSLDSDGCWRKHPTPFAGPGDKAYETHVAWGLIEADRVAPDNGYGEAALKQIHWAISNQHSNGWVANCCLSDPNRPLTHTLGYFLRGIIEGYLFCDDPALLQAAQKTADGLMSCLTDDGFLAGRLEAGWQPAVEWACLTGTAQIAHCWLLLHDLTGITAYRDAGFLANRYVRRTMHIDGNQDTRGGIKGSFPVDGAYGRYEFLNWAVKFAIDANVMEAQVRQADQRNDRRTLEDG